MTTDRYKMQDTRLKVQGSRHKAREGSLAPCILHLAPAQSGFSLISAIFLLVVIAALGTFAVTLSSTQQQSAAQDVLGARAYQAARAGIEWGAFQVLQNAGCPAPTQVLAAMPNTLANFRVQVDCSSMATTDAGTPVVIYQLTSTANQGTVAMPDYVERQISVTIAK